MDVQNIISQGQDSIKSTKNLMNLNQLNLQLSHSQSSQNQGGLINIQNMLEDISIGSEQTLKRQIKSQIIKRFIADKKRIFQNAVCLIVNQKESQHLILSYQNQQDKNFFQYLSSKHSNDQIFQSQHQEIFEQEKNCLQNDISQKEDQIDQKQTIKQLLINNQVHFQQTKKFKDQIDINLQKEEQQQNNLQYIKHEQSVDQKSILQKGNDQRQLNIFQQQDQLIYDENKNAQQVQQKENNSILSLQNICEQVKYISSDKNILIKTNIFEEFSKKLKKEDEKDEIEENQQNPISNLQVIFEQSNKIQCNNKDCENLSDNQQKKSTPTFQKEIQNFTNQQQFGIIQNTIKQHNLSKSYGFQLKKIFDDIQAYGYTEYEKQFEFDQIKKEWEEDIFERINGTQIQNEIFQSQKQKIFEILKQKQFYLCKIIYSNQMEDLFVGFFQDEYENFDEYIFKIIHSSIQSDIDQQNLIIKTLGLQFELIKLEQQNISIFLLPKDDYLSIPKKLEQLVLFEQNIQQVENNYEINQQNYQECTKCKDQQIFQNQNCFKDVKSRILDFLQSKKYSYCEYQNKLISGIIFQLSKEELIPGYFNFIHKTIFSFLENDQFDKQNISQQQSIQFCESIFEKKQNFSQEQNNNQLNEFDLINEYSFTEYQVLIKSDQNNEKINLSPNYQRKWDINIFNDLNKIKVSMTFQKQKKDIIQILKTKKYFLCNCFVSSQQEDIFMGYQEEIKEKYIDYIFVIKFNPHYSEIQKYLQIKQFNEEINYFIINGFAHILILTKDTFLQIYNNFEQDETSKGQQERIDQDINIEQFSEYDQKFNYFQDFKLINNNNTVKNLVKQFFNCLLKKQNESLVQDHFSQTISLLQKVNQKVLQINDIQQFKLNQIDQA
ncbi:hypothetical protein ABPG72_017839 [Tetrahymena utriculariae]